MPYSRVLVQYGSPEGNLKCSLLIGVELAQESRAWGVRTRNPMREFRKNVHGQESILATITFTTEEVVHEDIKEKQVHLWKIPDY